MEVPAARDLGAPGGGRRARDSRRSCRPEDGALLHVLAARRGIVRARPRSAPGAGRRGGVDRVRTCHRQMPFFTAEVVPELAEGARGALRG